MEQTSTRSGAAPTAGGSELDAALVVKLAQHTSGLELGDVSDRAVQQARLVLLDTLGAMLVGAAHGPSARIARDVGLDMGEHGRSTIVGEGARVAAPTAALCNGIAAHAFDLDDSHRFAAGYHPGATVIPAVLAVAEQESVGVHRVLEAILCGYEAGGRIGRAINPSHRYRGFHSTGTVGVFGAAAGAARVLGLDARGTAMALSVAGSMAGGVFAFLDGLHPTKHLHAGHAAQAGVTAALLARSGFTGPESILENAEGFFRAYADEFSTDAVTDELGVREEILSNYFKPYAACGHAFTAIEAALSLAEDLRSDDVDTIEVRTYRAAAVLNQRTPTTLQEGQFSVPFLVALALRDKTISIESVQAGLADDRVLAFAARCTVVEDDEMTGAFPALRPARIVATLRDGSTRQATATSAAGMPERPLSVEQIITKFRQMVKPILPADSAESLVDAVMNGNGPASELTAAKVTTHEVLA